MGRGVMVRLPRRTHVRRYEGQSDSKASYNYAVRNVRLYKEEGKEEPNATTTCNDDWEV